MLLLKKVKKKLRMSSKYIPTKREYFCDFWTLCSIIDNSLCADSGPDKKVKGREKVVKIYF